MKITDDGNELSMSRCEIEEEKKIAELMRNFNLSYQEVVLVLQEGLLPAIDAIGEYKKPPWSKETTPEMDEYYQELSSKYESLFGYLNENSLPE